MMFVRLLIQIVYVYKNSLLADHACISANTAGLWSQPQDQKPYKKPETHTMLV